MSSPTGQWLKLMFGLPALPPHEVARFYAEVLLLMKPPATLDAFISYLETTYINAGCKFPPIWWAGQISIVCQVRGPQEERIEKTASRAVCSRHHLAVHVCETDGINRCVDASIPEEVVVVL